MAPLAPAERFDRFAAGGCLLDLSAPLLDRLDLAGVILLVAGLKAGRTAQLNSPRRQLEFMDHATIEETFSRYGHLMPGTRDQARKLVDGYLASASSN